MRGRHDSGFWFCHFQSFLHKFYSRFTIENGHEPVRVSTLCISFSFTRHTPQHGPASTTVFPARRILPTPVTAYDRGQEKRSWGHWDRRRWRRSSHSDD
jgi:hypothetical protein